MALHNANEQSYSLSQDAIAKGYTLTIDEGTCLKVYNPNDTSVVPYYVHKDTMKGASWECEDKMGFAAVHSRKGGKRSTRKRSTRKRSSHRRKTSKRRHH